MNYSYLDGQIIPDSYVSISPDDCGLTTSIGVFDSMLAENGVTINADLHYQRLIHDCRTVIGLPLLLSFEDFTSIATELLQRSNITANYARIRTTVTGGIVPAPLSMPEKPTILIRVAATENRTSSHPLPCRIVEDYPRISGCRLENCKRLDYTRSFAARNQARKYGATDAILTNTNGNIACGTTSNLFIEENRNLITPPLNEGVLAGTTRAALLRDGKAVEEIISRERLKGADKIYLTNSFIGLQEIELITE